MSEQIEKISHIDHILKRPDSYVGPTSKVNGGEPHWVVLADDGDSAPKFVQKNLAYSPALLKIFDEILVNAIDRNSSFPNDVKLISVIFDKESGLICVENTGPLGGICVKMHPTEQIWNPELTFGHLLTSSNYDDTKKRTVGGRNGYGAKLTNIYSTMFAVTICDHVNGLKYTQKWEKNMTVCHPPKIAKYTKKTSSVNICFIPDWKLFGGGDGADPDFFKIVEKRVWDASFCTSPKCKVEFQGVALPKLSMDAFARMHLDEGVEIASFTSSASSDRWQVAIAPSVDGSGFQHVSFVNGICTTKGGTHVDYISKLAADAVIEDLSKKIKLKPQQVKNAFFVFVKCTLENPSFGSQVKSDCTLKPQEFGSRFDPPKNFAKNILKTGIQEELLALSKFKEMKELKKTDGAGRKSKITGIPKLDDANKAGTAAESGKCTLIVTEGDSAKTLAVAGLSVVGRDHYGVFPLRGKCKNVRDASVNQLMSNQEFNDLKKILGLQQDKVYTSLAELRYGRLMIMTDADVDGSHIKGLILNMIHFFWPSLLDLGFVVSMVTPIIRATKGKLLAESFYTDSAFRTWHEKQASPGSWKIKYYKGLGTSTSAEAREYFKNIKSLTVDFTTDPESDASIVLAFDKTKSDNRKVWLLESTAEKKKADLEVGYGSISELSITDFVHKDLVNFSLADLRRSVASMCDGLKPSQRKVMFASMSKTWKDEPKVAQLAAFVSEKTSYHHGEVSLADTIVKLAHNYVGSNNINLMQPLGQFGTRLMGGKDVAASRYIFSKPSEEALNLFDPRDAPVLTYLDDDGKPIEPEFFVPTLPVVLINGTEGIGTGFSCTVPPFNPEDIKANIARMVIEGKAPTTMSPWFKGFKGTVAAVEEDESRQSWIARGVWTKDSSRCATITELPPGVWTQDFKEHLDTLIEKKVISDYKNSSTVEDVHFKVYDYAGKNFEKDLKMQKTIRTSNMHLFHPVQGIKKYESAESILVDFVELRLEYYQKRKKHMLDTLKEELVVLENKSRFIRMVVEDELVIFKKKKAALELELEVLKFARISESFDYLLNIRTFQYTEEAIEKLETDLSSKNAEYAAIKKSGVMEMWNADILKIKIVK
jgi:DNA topoisomerase-2